MNSEQSIIIASEAEIAIRTIQDIPDVLGACFGATGLLLTEQDLAPAFFDLKSGLAGELLQKFVNYRLRVAIVVADPAAYGERFGELVREHRSHGLVRFAPTRAEADAWLGAD
ncbi:MAG: DUF4180 domain-containing protein [Caldilineaceae bacterium]|nr:DUF4180 domain-containing protein [Caldilineaceae bacterium]